MVAECFVLEVRVAVGECISETSVVCEQCEEYVLTAVSVSRCLPVFFNNNDFIPTKALD